MNKQLLMRVCGIAGLLGGLVLFAGDMLLYYSDMSTDLARTMGEVAEWRIVATAATALVAAWLYVLGVGQVYLAFEGTITLVRTVVTLCFGAVVIGYGIVHAAYTAIATSAQLAVANNLDFSASLVLAREANDMLRFMVYPFFAVLSVLFLHQVWTRRTSYPRWMVLGFPLILFLLQGMLTSLFSGTAWVVVTGGYLNLQLVIFFLLSTIALWRRT